MRKLFEVPFFGRGFRPFFFMTAVFGVLVVPLWIYQFSSGMYLASNFSNPSMWHAHEMIYGYTVAVVAGFLLTAVANWTGGAPVRAGRLAFLCGIWIAGRVAMNLNMPVMPTAVMDAAFIPCLAVALAVPLYRSRNLRNFIFLIMLAILFFLNAWFHMTQERMALYYALLVIATMISVIGGRIIPSFTVAGLRRRNVAARMTDQPVTDIIAIAGIPVLAMMWAVFGIDHVVSGAAALLLTIVHLIRMRFWNSFQSLCDPMLWILHAGYLWLAAGFALLGVSAFMPSLSHSTAIHALTAGSIGSLTIGMMVRVALGHTGRELVAGRGGTAAFLLMQLAAASRVAAPFMDADAYTALMYISAGSWALALAMYLLVFSPVLFGRRPDGFPA